MMNKILAGLTIGLVSLQCSGEQNGGTGDPHKVPEDGTVLGMIEWLLGLWPW